MEEESELFTELTKLFSILRISTYLNHTSCVDELDALAAHSWNIQLCQALYPALQTLEVILRNSIHNGITLKYQTEYWFDKILDSKEQKSIQEAKSTLIRQKKECQPNAIIAELRFGFWTSSLRSFIYILFFLCAKLPARITSYMQ